MKDILFINPPFINFIAPENCDYQLKKNIGLIIEDIIISSINVGILSLATYIKKKGFSFDILDMYKDSDLSRLADVLKNNQYRYVGVSCVTGFSYLVTMDIFSLVKKISPDTITIGGGMHLGPLGQIAMVDCSDIDIIAKYEGEIVLEMLLNGENPRNIAGIIYRGSNNEIVSSQQPSKLVDLNELTPFAWEDYPNYHQFLPFIEESRGCYGRCDYCVNCFVNQGKIRFKSKENIERDMEKTFQLFGRDSAYIIESLNFGVSVKRTFALIDIIKKYDISWGVQFRVDNPWPSYIDAMYEAGCRMFDVGIESANKEILLLMNKTKKPESYIENASKLINKVLSFPDASMSYNILFYAGENLYTLKDTISFIFSHQSPKVALSIFPVFLYPGSALYSNIDHYEQRYGTTVIKDEYWQKRHIYPLNLSSELSFDDILVFAKMIQAIFGLKSDHCVASKLLIDDINLLRKKLR